MLSFFRNMFFYLFPFFHSLSPKQSLPQRGLAGGFHSLHFAQVLLVTPTVVNHFVDDAPVVQAAYVAVVDVEVGVQFAAVAVGRVLLALGKVAVHCIELESASAAKVYSLLQQVAFANAPQYESVALGLQFFQCGYGKWSLFSYLWVLVFHDSSVKVYCYYHVCVVAAFGHERLSMKVLLSGGAAPRRRWLLFPRASPLRGGCVFRAP